LGIGVEAPPQPPRESPAMSLRKPFNGPTVARITRAAARATRWPPPERDALAWMVADTACHVCKQPIGTPHASICSVSPGLVRQGYCEFFRDRALAVKAHHRVSGTTLTALCDAAALDAALAALAMERRIWCDQPDDRLYHASDKTWWRRRWNADGTWSCVRADPPPGFDKEGK
jgi:hypothetical protein